MIVNPWGQYDLVNALRRCLEMNPIERADRMRRNVEFSTVDYSELGELAFTRSQECSE